MNAMRWLKWFSVGLLLFVVAAAALMATLVGTETGRLWLVQQATGFAARNGILVQLTDLRTPELGEWRLAKLLVVRDGATLIEVDHLELLWLPSALLEHRLSIGRLAAGAVIYNHLPAAETPEKKPAGELPQSPLHIIISDLEVKRLTLRNLDVSGRQLPDYRIAGSAEAFGPQYPLQLQLDLSSLDSDETLLRITTQAVSAQQVRLSGTLAEAPGGLLSNLLRWPKDEALKGKFALTLEKHEQQLQVALEELQVPLRGYILQAEGNVTYNNQSRSVTVHELILSTNGDRHRLRGGYSPVDLWAQADLANFPLGILEPWLADVSDGSASGVAELNWLHKETGRWPNISADATVDLVYKGQSYTASVTGHLENKFLELQPSSITVGEAVVRAEGQLDFHASNSDLRGTVTNLDTDFLRQWSLPIPEDLNASTDQAAFIVRGSLHDPLIHLDTNLNGTYKGRLFSLMIKGDGSRRAATINSAHLVSGDTNAKAKGQLDWTGRQTDLAVEFTDLRQDLLELLPDNMRPKALADITFSAAGRVWVIGDLRRPKVVTQSHISGTYAVSADSVPYKLTLDAAVQTGKLADLTMNITQVELSLFDKPTLTLNGHYRAHTMDLHLRMARLPVQTLEILGLERINGESEADLQITGSIKQPVVNGYLEYRDHLPGAGRRRVPVTVKTDVSTRDEQIYLQTTFLHNNEPAGNFAVYFPLGLYLQSQDQPVRPLQLNAEGEWDLRFLRLFVDAGNHRFDGRVAMDFNISGDTSAPLFVGKAQLHQGTYSNAATGTQLEDIQLIIEGDGQHLLLKEGRARSGDGYVALSGDIHWQEDRRSRPDAIDLTLEAHDAMLVQRRDLQGEMQGQVKVTGSFDELWVKGELEISPLNASVESAVTTRIPEIKVSEVNEDPADPKPSNLPIVHLDVTLVAERQAYLRGRGLDTELSGRISIQGTVAEPEYRGLFTTRRGRIDLFGKRFVLDNGEVRFNNDGVILRIPAVYKTEDLEIRAELYGTSDEPKLKLSSIPARPEDEILSRLIFDKPIEEITAFEAIRLAGAVRTLSSGGGGFDPVNSARQMLGVDALTIDNSNTESGSGVSVGVGKYLSEKVYLELKRSANPTQPWQGSVQIELTPKLTLQSGTSDSGGAGAELLWKRDY